MTSPNVGATASLIMFLIVCTGCIYKDLVEARKIEVIKQSDEHVYHDGPKAAPPSINTPEDMDESVYHTDYHGPCHNGGCWPPPHSLHNNLEDMDEDLVEARKIEVIKQSDEPAVYHDGPKAAPPSINTSEDMDESVYHTDYHGPCHNGGCWPPPHSLHNNFEDMDEDLVEARKIEVIKQSDEPAVYHDGPKAAPPSINTSEDMDESVYHTDYHGPCHNGGCWPPTHSLHNNFEDMDESVDHTDYRGVSTHPPGPPNSRKT